MVDIAGSCAIAARLSCEDGSAHRGTVLLYNASRPHHHVLEAFQTALSLSGSGAESPPARREAQPSFGRWRTSACTPVGPLAGSRARMLAGVPVAAPSPPSLRCARRTAPSSAPSSQSRPPATALVPAGSSLR
jgi:hypothetical protein